jgi:integrase
MTETTRVIPSVLRSATYQTIIGLLAVSGMRVGEALRLQRSDIDWVEGVATVYATKFGKSREPPLAERRWTLWPTTPRHATSISRDHAPQPSSCPPTERR